MRLGLYAQHVVPRIVDVACGARDIRPLRERVCADLHGVVLEIGYGSGLNLRVLPSAVTRVLAVEPSEVAKKISTRRMIFSAIPVEMVGLDGASITLADASVDSALSTFALCTIPDVTGALREVHRVLRPGAAFHILEHGRSPVPGVARRQDRWNPLQKRIAGGCQVNRDMVRLVEEAGFLVEHTEHPGLRGPAVLSYLTLAVARKP